MMVSLIIPVYNVEKYLETCVQSALAQTWPDYEIILIDDGSTDRSAALCREYDLKHSRIRLIRQKNQGLMSAWKRGLQASIGEYVAFLDGDDWIEPDYIARMALSAKGADVVCCSFIREYPHKQVFQKEIIAPGRYGREEIRKRIYPILVNNGTYLGRGITPHRWGKLIRKSLMEENLCWCDPQLTFGEDLNIMFPVFLSCNELAVLEDQVGLYHYRQNPASILHGYKENMFLQMRTLYHVLKCVNEQKKAFDFSDQIQRDALCLFMEYVKNETKVQKDRRDPTGRILENYEIMKTDFAGTTMKALRLKLTDRLLYGCLERKAAAVLQWWMSAYRICKQVTGERNWKSKRRYVRVLMAGPDLSVRGGIRTVADQYVHWNKWEHVRLRYVPVYVEKNILHKIIFFAGGCLTVWTQCMLRRADVLHLHMAEKGSFYRKAVILFLCRLSGVKTVIHHHGAEFLDFYDRTRGIRRRWIRYTLEHAGVNLVLGYEASTQMKKRFPEASFQVLRNTIRVPAENEYCVNAEGILFAGRLGERKGVYDFLRAVRLCDAELDEKVKIYLCGDGEIMEVRRAAAQLGIGRRIRHLGWVSPGMMENVYHRAMIFVLPSHHEGMPMALLEAMSHGIPCIAGGTDAIPEVIENEYSGILIKPKDIQALARAILDLAKDPERRRRIGECGYIKVKESFDVEKGMREQEQIWRELLR